MGVFEGTNYLKFMLGVIVISPRYMKVTHFENAMSFSLNSWKFLQGGEWGAPAVPSRVDL